jgi:hypothetical protein
MVLPTPIRVNKKLFLKIFSGTSGYSLFPQKVLWGKYKKAKIKCLMKSYFGVPKLPFFIGHKK